MTSLEEKLYEALTHLYAEVVASGNASKRDFGWSKAVKLTQAALRETKKKLAENSNQSF